MADAFHTHVGESRTTDGGVTLPDHRPDTVGSWRAVREFSSARGPQLARAHSAGTNFIDSEFTQCRVSFGVKRSPSKTCPR